MNSSEWPLISVIIPIYNVENYVRDCIESVLKQSYKNLEVIIINDGSQDNSRTIVADMIRDDERFILLDKENGGLSETRNFGLERSRGEYIAFIDSDDIVSPFLIENLYYALERSGTLLSMCKMTRKLGELNRGIVRKYHVVKGDFTRLVESLGINWDHMPNDAAWDKLYHRSLFDNVRFPVGQIFEDSSVIYPLVHQVDQYAIVDSIDYYYREAENSITQDTIHENHFDLLRKNQLQIDFLRKHHPETLKFGYANVLNANDYWAMKALYDGSPLAIQFFEAIWKQNFDFSRELGFRKVFYVNRWSYRMLIKLGSLLYHNSVLKMVIKHTLARKEK